MLRFRLQLLILLLGLLLLGEYGASCLWVEPHRFEALRPRAHRKPVVLPLVVLERAALRLAATVGFSPLDPVVQVGDDMPLRDAVSHAQAHLDSKLERVEGVLTERGEQAFRCADLPPPLGGRRAARTAQALELAAAGRHIEAAKLLCTSSAAVQVQLTPAEKRRGMLTAGTSLQLHALLSICGVASVQALFSPEAVDKLRAAQHELAGSEQMRQLTDRVNSKGSILETVASRGANRYEVQLPMQPPYTDAGAQIVAHPTLVAVLKLVLRTPQLELDTFSYIESRNGSETQTWHVDAGGVIDTTFVPPPGAAGASSAARRHLPPFGIVATVPTVNLTGANGPTEFLTGSHVDVEAGGTAFWENQTRSDDESPGATYATPAVALQAKVGDVVLFDLRCRHRGRRNRSGRARTLLYLSYVKRWFRDATNFKMRHTRAWDSLPSERHRALFSRVDERQYVALLEQELSARGVDVAALASTLKHNRYPEV